MLLTSGRSDIADPPSSARDLDDYLTMTSNRSIMLYLLQLVLDGSIDMTIGRFSVFVLPGWSQGLCCNPINTMPEGDVSKTHKLRLRP
jgi:hypothetical protein